MKTATDRSGGFQAVLRLTEAQFQAQVIRYARLMGWHTDHDVATNAPRRCRACGIVQNLPRNQAGRPDLLLLRHPRVVWAELKSDRGRLTPEQREWIEELCSCGQEVHVWRPKDWPEIEEALR